MIPFISSSEMREKARSALQVGQTFPACRSSMGPFRNASATIILASRANTGSTEDFFMVHLYARHYFSFLRAVNEVLRVRLCICHYRHKLARPTIISWPE